MQDIGQRIRKLREQREMSGKELAEKVGLTGSHISQVERGKANLSVNTLNNIASALGVPLTMLFRSSTPSPVVRREERERIVQPNRTLESLIQTALYPPFGVYVVRATREYDGSSEVFGYRGTLFFTVVSGAFELRLEQELHTLQEGDSICYDSSKAHSGKVLSDELVLLVVNSPFVMQQG